VQEGFALLDALEHAFGDNSTFRRIWGENNFPLNRGVSNKGSIYSSKPARSMLMAKALLKE